MNLTEMAIRAGKANARWWIDLETGKPIDRHLGELCMLAVSELAEAMEGHRKGLMDDKLPHRSMLEVELVDAAIRLMDMAFNKVDWSRDKRDDTPLILPASGVMEFSPNMGENLFRITRKIAILHDIENSESRLFYSICIWAIVDLMNHLNLDFEKTFDEKMAYNATRIDHTKEGRLAPGGKKY